MSETLYVKYNDGEVVGYAYGEPWVAQALAMDDWKYDTQADAVRAWAIYKEGKNEDNMEKRI